MSYALHYQHGKKEHCAQHREKWYLVNSDDVINTGIQFSVALSGECAKVNLKFGLNYSNMCNYFTAEGPY
jgi:hypothetical protein